MLSALLPELKCLLLSYLNRSDIGFLACVSREFRLLVDQPWYWKARINRAFPTMLCWFPHEDTASGRESLRAYYYFLVDTEALREAGRNKTRMAKDKLLQSSNTGSYYINLGRITAPIPIDSFNDDLYVITEYSVEINFDALSVTITYSDQTKETPIHCRDLGCLALAKPRLGPYLFPDPAPAEVFESQTPTEMDGNIRYYNILYDQLLPWLEAKINRGYLCLDDHPRSAAIVERHYNWFLDYGF